MYVIRLIDLIYVKRKICFIILEIKQNNLLLELMVSSGFNVFNPHRI